ncbi:hypothetical protein OKB57_07430 [Serratia marcescens]|uniref:hypothetical protein n=1 Tax=Serratia marcescens TaxID=615 RepID=UPI0022250545|nr:hypothetical protein [Serratia marcescens]UYY69037.1 hypothetical protein OKB57_07430 [Serratia marcescens]
MISYKKTIPALVIFALSNAVAYANDFDKSNEAMAISAIGFSGSNARVAHDVCGATNEKIDKYKKQIKVSLTRTLKYEQSGFDTHWDNGWKNADFLVKSLSNDEAYKKEYCQEVLDGINNPEMN